MGRYQVDEHRSHSLLQHLPPTIPVPMVTSHTPYLCLSASSNCSHGRLPPSPPRHTDTIATLPDSYRCDLLHSTTSSWRCFAIIASVFCSGSLFPLAPGNRLCFPWMFSDVPTDKASVYRPVMRPASIVTMKPAIIVTVLVLWRTWLNGHRE